MPIPTTTASPWPARCAYISAAIFTAASGGTNLIYGWQKGDTLATSIVWSGVAGAVAVVFALSWPALIRSVDAKRYNAAVSEAAQTDARNKAQSAYDGAKAELGALAIATPAAEIQRMIETTKSEL